MGLPLQENGQIREFVGNLFFCKFHTASPKKIQIECVEDLGSGCYSNSESKTVMLNMIEYEFERAFNDTTDLGQDYIRFCPLLSNNEGAVVERGWGSRRCSYFKAEAGFRRSKACFASRASALTRALDRLPDRQLSDREL